MRPPRSTPRSRARRSVAVVLIALLALGVGSVLALGEGVRSFV
jgi:hypothetical protein